MPALIDSLRRDHADIEFLLQTLEQEIAAFDRTERPDFDILRGIVDYFRSYPAQCHHPKEDLLFAKLRVLAPDRAAAMIDIEAEHGQAARRLERFARLIDEVLNERQVERAVLDAAVREFVAHERRHMELEERELLPNAPASLQAEDWPILTRDWSRRGTLCSVAMSRSASCKLRDASPAGSVRTGPSERG